MELNTEYWGEGVQASWSKYFYCMKNVDNDNTTSWYYALDSGRIPLNEEIDQSIMYGFSYKSHICEMALTKPVGTRTPMVDRMEAPFTKYSIQRGSNHSPTKSYLNDMQYRIGYGVKQFETFSGQEIYVRYALAKIRFLCYVDIFEFIENSEENLIRNNSWHMTLNDFLNNNLYKRYVNNDNIYVTGLSWVCYYENDAGTANVISDNTQPVGFFTIPAVSEAFNDYTGDNDIYLPQTFFWAVNGRFTQGGEGASRQDSESQSIGRSVFYNTSNNWDFLIAYDSGSSYSKTYAYVTPDKLMDVFHEFAYFGLYYTGTQSVAESTALNLDDLYLGKMSNINGATDGDYIAFNSNESATDALAKAIGANEATATGTDPMQDPNPHYSGATPEDEDPNTYVTKTPLSTPTLSPIDVFNRTYAMTAIQIRALADFLWNADDDKMTEILKGLELYGENPLNGLIDCRLYPFDLSGISISGQEIIVGRVNTQVYGRKILNTANVVFDLGTCKFMKYFHNFLDYAPYTTGRLFLPYCGMVPIDTAEFMGKEIECKLIVDLITGACCCCIFLDGILTITANGLCGVEISMTGTDSAAYASSIVNQFANSVMQVAGGVAAIAGGAALAGTGAGLVTRAANIATPNNDRLGDYTKGLNQERMGSASAGAGMASLANGMMGFWNMEHTPTQYAQRGSSTPSCETWLPQYPFFIVDSPITDIPSGYGHNVGFACIETGTLSSFSGFTICSNVDTSGFAQATEAERNELKMLLEAGVFL